MMLVWINFFIHLDHLLQRLILFPLHLLKFWSLYMANIRHFEILFQYLNFYVFTFNLSLYIFYIIRIFTQVYYPFLQFIYPYLFVMVTTFSCFHLFSILFSMLSILPILVMVYNKSMNIISLVFLWKSILSIISFHLISIWTLWLD